MDRMGRRSGPEPAAHHVACLRLSMTGPRLKAGLSRKGSAMRILIAGASGAIGRPLVRRLRANQHEVFALTRSPGSAPALKAIGAEAVIADALDAAAVKAAVGRIRPDAVINQLTSLPRHNTPADM